MTLSRRLLILALAVALGVGLLLAFALPQARSLWQDGQSARQLSGALDDVYQQQGTSAAKLEQARAAIPDAPDSAKLLTRITEAARKSGVTVSAGKTTTSDFPIPTLVGRASGSSLSVAVTVDGSREQVSAFTSALASAQPLMEVTSSDLVSDDQGRVHGTMTASTYAVTSPQFGVQGE